MACDFLVYLLSFTTENTGNVCITNCHLMLSVLPVKLNIFLSISFISKVYILSKNKYIIPFKADHLKIFM